MPRTLPTHSAAAAVLLCLPALLWCPAAPAQVVRCTDARTGAVTYTDGGCERGSTAHEVQPRQSAQEIDQERAQAAQALERERERQRAQASAERLQAERDAARAQAAQAQQAARPGATDPAHSPECARARRALDAAAALATNPAQAARVQAAQQQMELDCLGPTGYTELQRSRPPPVLYLPSSPQPPHWRPARPAPRLTHCNVFRCYDSQGRSHPRP